MRSQLLAAIAAAAGLLACRDVAPPPSIVLVSIDTLRADHVGAYGYERDTTPFLDRLAGESLVFENAWTPASWTLIAHMTMLTGLPARQHGVVDGDLALSTEVPLLAERLQAAGYQTVGLYFKGWISTRHGFERGFDVFREHLDAEEAREHWREELARLDPKRPFFLFLHLFDVHAGPVTPGERVVYPSPEPFLSKFLPDALQRLAHRSAGEVWTARDLDPSEVEALVALYDGGVSHADARLQDLYQDLQAREALDSTFLLVTADHGESLAQRGPVNGHGTVFQEGLHVPLLLRHPRGERAGERVPAPVSLYDIVPTVLKLCGLGDPALPGRSLLAPLPPQRPIVGGRFTTRHVVIWPEKYVSLQRGDFFRFDLERDPDERAPERISAAEFEAVWTRSNAGIREFPPPLEVGAMSEDDAALLRGLGYGGEVGDDEER